MSRNRYVKDYRLVENVNGRGRIRTTYEYIGDDYYFIADRDAVHAARKRLAALCAAGWAAFIGALLPVSAAARSLYVILPFVVASWPLALLTGLTASLCFVHEPLEHRHADRLENRFPACAAIVMILCAVSLAGEGVNLVLKAPLPAGDLVFSACAAILFASALYIKRLPPRLLCRAK